MLFTVDENHKKHLLFLNNFSDEVIKEFSVVAIEFLKKKINVKVCQSAAQKLEADPDSVTKSIEGLMYLFTESTKLMVNSIDFYDSLLTMGLSENLCKELQNIYMENQKALRQLLSCLPHSALAYHNLEWRLDIEISSRSLKQQINPLIILKFTLEKDGKKSFQYLQTDPVNLLHMTKILEEALQEIKTQHCRRITRYIK